MSDLAELDFTLDLACEFGQHGADAPPAEWWYRTPSHTVAACRQCAARWNGPSVLGRINQGATS